MKDKAILLAECVAALWKLGSREGDTMPDTNGIIDKAIEAVYREIPDLEKLSFSNTSVGRRCLNWPEAAVWQQELGIVEIDGTTYTEIKVLIDGQQAYEILYGQSLSKGQRRRLADQFCRMIQRGRVNLS